MAENAGHLAIVESSPDDSVYTEIDGCTMTGVDRDKDIIDVTSMKDASGHKVKISGLKDSKASLEGHVVFTASTFVLDLGISNVFRRARDGGLLALRTKLDGSGGSYRTLASGLVSELSISGEVDGSVKWSAGIQANGAGWA